MLDLNNKGDLQRLVDEGLEESLTLDYKASGALTRDSKNVDELCKDVSAFANSAGGQLVYGIEEDKGAKKPSRVDDGVIDPKISREWIEQILNSKVQPRMSGITTTRIEMSTGQFGYVITVPQSQTGPHQAPDHKYYKRFDLQAVPMHDYEIKDIMRRATTPELEAILTFDGGQESRHCDVQTGAQLSETVILHCNVRNKSSTPAHHVVVDFLVDYDLIIPFDLQPFRQIGERDVAPEPKMRIFRRVINCPPLIPIFQGGGVAEHTGGVAVQIPFQVVNGGQIFFETLVKSPGSIVSEKWRVEAKNGLLKFVPPVHMRPPRTSVDRWSA